MDFICCADKTGFPRPSNDTPNTLISMFVRTYTAKRIVLKFSYEIIFEKH